MIQTSDNICTDICKAAVACHIVCRHSHTNCCLECYILDQKLEQCKQLKGTDYFKFIIIYHKLKKREEKKMHNCPGCNSPLLKKYVTYHEGEMAYCPECGWNEEDGDNYKSPKAREEQLRLEGM